MRLRIFPTACGAPLYVVERPHAKSIAMGVLVHVGTRDEMRPAEAGLAHAFEHVVFRGNDRFLTEKEVVAHIEEVGGYCDASTSKETTMFYAVVPGANFDRAVIYFYNLLSAPLLREKDIESEMSNILCEIRDRNDSPAELVQDVMEAAIYGDHPLAADILGSVRTVSAFSRDDFLRCLRKFYYPENFVFIVVGNVNGKKIRDAINGLFSFKTGRTPNVRQAITHIKSKRQEIVSKDVEQVNLCLGVPMGAARERSTKALGLFAAMIGGGMSSPLFQEIRSRLGLCYAIEAEAEPRSDRGLFYVYASVDAEHCRDAIAEIKRVIKTGARDKELFSKTKQRLIGQTALLYEHPLTILVKAVPADILLEGRPRSLEETIRDIEGIQFSEVVDAVGRYLEPKNFVQALVAPKNFQG